MKLDHFRMINIGPWAIQVNGNSPPRHHPDGQGGPEAPDAPIEKVITPSNGAVINLGGRIIVIIVLPMVLVFRQGDIRPIKHPAQNGGHQSEKDHQFLKHFFHSHLLVSIPLKTAFRLKGHNLCKHLLFLLTLSGKKALFYPWELVELKTIKRGKIMKKYIAELVGTFTLVLFGCGTAVVAGAQVGNLGIAFAFGLALISMAYGIGPISGCHINPAVSIGAFVAGRLPVKDLVGYIVAQCAGAILGAWVLSMIMKGQIAGYDIAAKGLGQNGWGPGYLGEYNLT